jgi:hypothetical protein
VAQIIIDLVEKYILSLNCSGLEVNSRICLRGCLKNIFINEKIRNLTPLNPLPYLSLTLSYEEREKEKLLLAGMGVLKPLPPWGRGLERGYYVNFGTFQTTSNTIPYSYFHKQQIQQTEFRCNGFYQQLNNHQSGLSKQ